MSGLYQPCFTAVRGSSISRQTHEYALAVKGGVSGGGGVRIGVCGRVGRGQDRGVCVCVWGGGVALNVTFQNKSVPACGDFHVVGRVSRDCV